MYASKKTSRQTSGGSARDGGVSTVYARNLTVQFQRLTTSFFEPDECSYKMRQFSYRRRSRVGLRRRNKFKW
jgi:hypothetical protein